MDTIKTLDNLVIDGLSTGPVKVMAGRYGSGATVVAVREQKDGGKRIGLVSCDLAEATDLPPGHIYARTDSGLALALQQQGILLADFPGSSLTRTVDGDEFTYEELRVDGLSQDPEPIVFSDEVQIESVDEVVIDDLGPLEFTEDFSEPKKAPKPKRKAPAKKSRNKTNKK